MPLDRKHIDRSKPVRHQAVSVLEEAIFHGRIRPGEEVPQLRLSKLLGLSQPSIREALQELEHRGLVVKRGRSRAVTNLSEQELGDIYQARILLEPFACRLAAYHWCEKMDDELEQCLDNMRQSAHNRDYVGHIRQDLEFHRTLWKHQPNGQLGRLLNVLCTPLFAYELVWRGGAGVLDFASNLRQTGRILMALRTRDGERAERLVRRILERFQRSDLADYHRLKWGNDSVGTQG
ncbi:MAG: GntR family transcriptional regulator [Acidobacteriota bacterium]